MSSKPQKPSKRNDSNFPNSPSPAPPDPVPPQVTIADEAIQLGLLDIASDQPAGTVAKTRRKKKERAPGNIQRVDTRDELEAAVFDKGGDDICLRNVSGTVYKVAFGMSAPDLYEEVGGIPGDRDTLPAQCQRKLQLHELVLADGLRNVVIIGVDQRDTNNQILQLVRREANALEHYLKARNLFQNVPIRPRKQFGELEPTPVNPLLNAPPIDVESTQLPDEPV